ncbi:LysR family transcriptional regulator [Pseudomonas sp. gcc21]|uniref:LysR family transcriptional regulator n=1 Tax=Pseudomonas sp. gcc21 TaxID=2726989 RepID=UPI001452A5A5|nr:LysR family transcriptional regulator [Pseudomonas sp. gcc21]QJD58331.1 LysR family transcriptional regulator [Pseudomonas sp. gcc21]
MHDFNELTVFAAVVEQGGLTQVSVSLGLPKSTLSRRISQLETRVGQRLLLRQSNRMLPTEAGKLFYNYCRQLLDLAVQSQDLLDDLKEEISGPLVLRVHNAFERGWLPTVLDGFLETHAGVTLELSVTSLRPEQSDHTVGDLWLWLGGDSFAGLRNEPLGRWISGLYASPEFAKTHGLPTHPEQLPTCPWVDVLCGAGGPVHLHSPNQGAFQFTPPPSRLKSDSLVLQADCLVRGQGVGILPEWYAEKYERAHPGSLVRCLEGWSPAEQPINLLYSFGKAPKKVTALVDWLRQHMPSSWEH